MEQKIRVLIADDDLLLDRVLSIDLREKGYEVAVCASAYGLMSVIGEFQPDILFLDWELDPSHSSLSFAKQIQEKYPSLPFLFISSHAEADVQREALNTSAKAYIKKPITADELIVHIQKWVTTSKRDTYTSSLLLYDEDMGALLKDGEPFRYLSEQENLLMQLLYDNKEVLVTRKDLVNTIWHDSDVERHERGLNNLILRIRGYLNECASFSIKTQRGIGYILTEIK